MSDSPSTPHPFSFLRVVKSRVTTAILSNFPWNVSIDTNLKWEHDSPKNSIKNSRVSKKMCRLSEGIWRRRNIDTVFFPSMAAVCCWIGRGQGEKESIYGAWNLQFFLPFHAPTHFPLFLRLKSISAPSSADFKISLWNLTRAPSTNSSKRLCLWNPSPSGAPPFYSLSR